MSFLIIFNTVLILFGSILLSIYVWAKRNASYWKRQGVPNKNILPLFGNFFGLVRGKRGVVDIFSDMYNDAESVSSPIYGCNVFHKPSLLIKDPEIIKKVLIKDFNLFMNRYSGSNLGNDKIGGNILVFLKGIKWKYLRANLTPTFSSAKLKQMFYLKAEVGKELQKLMKNITGGKTGAMEVYDIVGRYTTDVIATCAFGVQANSLRDPESEFRANGKRIFDTSPGRAIELLAAFYVPQVVKMFSFNVFSKETNDFFKSTIPQVMDEREKSGAVRNDLLDTLISFRKQYQDEQLRHVQYGINDLKFDNDVLIAQSAVFFAAGFETSSSAVSFCLYELAKHSDIQKKLRTEIKMSLEQNDGNISYEYIDGLQYLHQVLSETLRMYPPLANLDRMYEAPDKKTKYSLEPYHNFEIPHGMPIFIPVHAIHMDPKHYPDPYKFDPDRFLDKSIYNSGTYMPFGLGPRKCIGDRFGLIQSKIALVYILKDNFVAPNEKTSQIAKFDRKSFLLKADGGIWLNVIPDEQV